MLAEPGHRTEVLRALGRIDEAGAAYRQAITLAPRYADPLNGFGSVQVQQGRAREALPYFDRALALEPDRLEVRLNRAIALDEMGDQPGAIEEYRAFLTAAAERPEFASERQIARSLLSRVEGKRSHPRSNRER